MPTSSRVWLPKIAERKKRDDVGIVPYTSPSDEGDKVQQIIFNIIQPLKPQK